MEEASPCWKLTMDIRRVQVLQLFYVRRRIQREEQRGRPIGNTLEACCPFAVMLIKAMEKKIELYSCEGNLSCTR